MFLFPFEVFWASFPFLLFLKTLELNWKTSASCAAETRNTRWPLCLVRPEKSNAIKVPTAQPRVLPVQFWLTVTQRDWSHCIFIIEAAGCCSSSHSGCLVSSGCKETTSDEEFEVTITARRNTIPANEAGMWAENHWSIIQCSFNDVTTRALKL